MKKRVVDECLDALPEGERMLAETLASHLAEGIENMGKMYAIEVLAKVSRLVLREKRLAGHRSGGRNGRA